MEQQKLASLWNRMFGAFIDLIIVCSITFVIMFIWGFYIGVNGSELFFTKSESDVLWDARSMTTGVMVDCIYNVLLMGGEKQSTYGQRVVGIKIIKDSGKPFGYLAAIGRWVISVFSSVFLKLGFLIALFSKKRKTFHDLIVGTTVIEYSKNAAFNEPYAAQISNVEIANEDFYAQALDEIKKDRKRQGLWAISLARNKGDTNIATADYINQRVNELTQSSKNTENYEHIEYVEPKNENSISLITVAVLLIVVFAMWLFAITMLTPSDNELGNFFRELFNVRRK